MDSTIQFLATSLARTEMWWEGLHNFSKGALFFMAFYIPWGILVFTFHLSGIFWCILGGIGGWRVGRYTNKRWPIGKDHG